jgi:hypothetical protein
LWFKKICGEEHVIPKGSVNFFFPLSFFCNSLPHNELVPPPHKVILNFLSKTVWHPVNSYGPGRRRFFRLFEIILVTEKKR